MPTPSMSATTRARPRASEPSHPVNPGVTASIHLWKRLSAKTIYQSGGDLGCSVSITSKAGLSGLFLALRSGARLLLLV